MRKIKAKYYVESQISINKRDWKKYINFGQTNNAIKCENNVCMLQDVNTILEAWQAIINKASIEFKPTITLDGNKRQIEFIGTYTEEEYNAIVKAVALGRGLNE